MPSCGWIIFGWKPRLSISNSSTLLTQGQTSLMWSSGGVGSSNGPWNVSRREDERKFELWLAPNISHIGPWAHLHRARAVSSSSCFPDSWLSRFSLLNQLWLVSWMARMASGVLLPSHPQFSSLFDSSQFKALSADICVANFLRTSSEKNSRHYNQTDTTAKVIKTTVTLQCV